MKVKYLLIGLLATLLPATAVLADELSTENQKIIETYKQQHPGATPEEIELLKEFLRTHRRSTPYTAAEIEARRIAEMKYEAEHRQQQRDSNPKLAANKPFDVKNISATPDSVTVSGNGLKKGTLSVTVTGDKGGRDTQDGAVIYNPSSEDTSIVKVTFAHPIGEHGDIVSVKVTKGSSYKARAVTIE